jgi:hypothetical protein
MAFVKLMIFVIPTITMEYGISFEFITEFVLKLKTLS